MRWLGRLFLVPFALALAIGASSVFFLMASIVDPVMASLTGNALFVGFWSLMDAVTQVDDPAPVIEGAAAGFGRLAFSLLVAPPVFIALLSEVIGARRLVWHAGAMGLLTALMPWMLRGSGRVATPEELSIAVVLGLTGALAGLVYWAIAGQSAGAPRALSAPTPRGS